MRANMSLSNRVYDKTLKKLMYRPLLCFQFFQRISCAKQGQNILIKLVRVN